MNEEKQIEEMGKIICSHVQGQHGCDNCGLYESKSCAPFNAAREIYNADYRKQNGWTSVEERLPEREGTYLVYTYKGAIKFGGFRCYYAENDKPQFDYYVTHWMPLPEAPKMKGGAE